MKWRGGKWDNCNSIINKYILKKEKKQKTTFHSFPFKYMVSSLNSERCILSAVYHMLQNLLVRSNMRYFSVPLIRWSMILTVRT